MRVFAAAGKRAQPPLPAAAPQNGAAAELQVSPYLAADLLVRERPARVVAALLAGERQVDALRGVERAIAQIDHHVLLPPRDAVRIDEAEEAARLRGIAEDRGVGVE